MSLVVEQVFQNLTQSTIEVLPNLVWALVVLLIGYILGQIVGSAVKKILSTIHLDKQVRQKSGLIFEAEAVLTLISKWIIYLIFIQQSAEILKVQTIMNVVNQVIGFIPGIVGAVTVLIATYLIAIYVKETVIGSQGLYADILGKVTAFLIMYLGIATALPLIGINPTLINTILVVIVASVGVGIALALGLGLKDVVAEIAKARMKKFAKK